jgi:hypothetical protein
MLTRKVWLGLAAVAAAGFLSAGMAMAADAPAGGDTGAAGGARQGRQRGNFDPAQMRQQMNDRMKTAMGATDDEWKVLQPKIEAVQTAQRDSRGGGMGMMGGRGGARGGRGGAAAAGGAAAGGDAPAAAPAATARPQSEAAKAGDALRKVLDNKEAKPEEIKAALQAFRDARTAGEAKLAAAQKELKDIVTVKQEAYLVVSGMLK